MYGTLWTWNVSASKYIRTVCVDKMLVHYETRSIVCYTTTWYTYRAYTPWSHVSMVRWDMIRRMCATISPSCQIVFFFFHLEESCWCIRASVDRPTMSTTQPFAIRSISICIQFLFRADPHVDSNGRPQTRNSSFSLSASRKHEGHCCCFSFEPLQSIPKQA